MAVKNDFRHTVRACYAGYITQAAVNNFAPLLFLTFQREYGIPLTQIGMLITINFFTQLMTDLLSAKFADRIGYRKCAVGAHIFAAVGLLGLGIFPEIFPTPFMGLIAAVILYAVGGGLIEVLVSPIVEACPGDAKSGAMSLLHSFYCWGQVLTVLVSTLFFRIFGIDDRILLALIWAVIPALNAVYFCFVPINPITEEGVGLSAGQLFRDRRFLLLMLLMVCAGASELAVSQWASAFAESALHVSKTVGDIAGPCAFAVLMGTARAVYGKNSEKIPLRKMMAGSAVLCIVTYLMISLSPSPAVSLAGCALCGMSVGILWPGTFSLASKTIPEGGTAMFAYLALAGDLGCLAGPEVVSLLSGNGLKTGILAAVIFPVIMLTGVLAAVKKAADA